MNPQDEHRAADPGWGRPEQVPEAGETTPTRSASEADETTPARSAPEEGESGPTPPAPETTDAQPGWTLAEPNARLDESNDRLTEPDLSLDPDARPAWGSPPPPLSLPADSGGSPGWGTPGWGPPASTPFAFGGSSSGWQTRTGADSRSSGTGRLTVVVLGTSLLAALVASVGTAALVVPAAQPAATPIVGTAQPAAHTVIQVVDGSQAIVDVAARVSPAVVTITNSNVGSGFGPFSVPETGVGSGFIFRSDGLILTNWHVVEGTDQVTVALNDGRQLTGRVVATDQSNDLAVVKVDATGLPVALLGTSSDLKTGQLVIAIGSPLGTFTDSVTSGIVSATGRSLAVSGNGRGREQLSNLLQTDAAINEGNSGGPLLDASGQVIGINVAVATSAQGIGFAVPVDAAQGVISQAGG